MILEKNDHRESNKIAKTIDMGGSVGANCSQSIQEERFRQDNL
jgi:hypothetical protein